MPNDPSSDAGSIQFLSTASAAKNLGLSATWVQTLVDQGDPKGWKTRGGHRRISSVSVLEYPNQAHMTLSRKVRTSANAESSYRSFQFLTIQDLNVLYFIELNFYIQQGPMNNQ